MWETQTRGRYEDSWRSSLDVHSTQRFPSPYDSTIARRIDSIAFKYGVALSPSRTRPISSHQETKAFIESIRKKYLSPAIPNVAISTEEPDFQVSVSVSEGEMGVDEEVQTFIQVLDRGAQTDKPLNSPAISPQSPLKSRKSWDITQLPPVAPPLLHRSPPQKDRPISRRRIRRFEEYLEENPVYVSVEREWRDRSPLERDEVLGGLERRREEVRRGLVSVGERRREIVGLGAGA